MPNPPAFAMDKSYGTDSGTNSGTGTLPLKRAQPAGTGFFPYKMAPESASEVYQHNGDEEFHAIEGDLTGNDGTPYQAGDLVLLKSDTQHNSTAKTGVCWRSIFLKWKAICTPSGNLV